MKILIIEDEAPAANRLHKMIVEAEPDAEIITTIDSVEDSVKWFNQNEEPDLIFMDIQLADGLSFDIFNQTNIKAPVIFTTAFDQYAIQAFKSNGLDYLLKPLIKEELVNALTKYKSFNKSREVDYTKLITTLQKKESYKERFMVKSGEQLKFIFTKDIAYFYSESSYTYLVTKIGEKHIIDSSLEILSNEINPNDFHQISRKLIVSIASISKISTYFNSRLKLDLTPSFADVIVSRERVKEFKEWLDR